MNNDRSHPLDGHRTNPSETFLKIKRAHHQLTNDGDAASAPKRNSRFFGRMCPRSFHLGPAQLTSRFWKRKTNVATTMRSACCRFSPPPDNSIFPFSLSLSLSLLTLFPILFRGRKDTNCPGRSSRSHRAGSTLDTQIKSSHAAVPFYCLRPLVRAQFTKRNPKRRKGGARRPRQDRQFFYYSTIDPSASCRRVPCSPAATAAARDHAARLAVDHLHLPEA
jgi:hypothetical protein